MMSVSDIERAIAELPPEDFAAFRAWFERFEAERFDAVIERDAAKGRFDRLADEALAAHRAGQTREL